jgi:hypothetical protein
LLTLAGPYLHLPFPKLSARSRFGFHLFIGFLLFERDTLSSFHQQQPMGKALGVIRKLPVSHFLPSKGNKRNPPVLDDEINGLASSCYF